MSTDPEPAQTDSSLLPPDDMLPPGAAPDDRPPAEPEPIEVGPEPEEEREIPSPPEEPGELVVPVEPATWYEVTSVCVTTTCPNLNTTTTEPFVYSNAGELRIVCGVCGGYRPILAHTKRDPQPEMT